MSDKGEWRACDEYQYLAEMLSGAVGDRVPQAWLDAVDDFMRVHALAIGIGPDTMNEEKHAQWLGAVQALAQILSHVSEPPAAWLAVASAALQRMEKVREKSLVERKLADAL